jgi:hypothetical protein
MSPEVTRTLNFFASSPVGHTTMTRKDVREMLLETGGNLLAGGRLYDIVAKDIGAGVYKVTLQLSNP